MTAKRYLITLLTAVLAGIATIAILFCAHLGMPWWPHHLIREVRMAKHYMARSVEGPTIWIQGGSSAWFGFDSPQIKTETGYEAVNLAFNVNMPTEFCFDEIRRFAKPGDVALLALENSMYFRESLSSYAADEISIWAPDYFWSLSLSRKARFLKSLPWRKALAGNLVRLGQLTGAYNRALRPIDEESLIKNLHDQWNGSYSGEIPVYYNYLTLNQHGDFVQTDHTLWRGTHDYNLMGTAPVSDEIRQDLEEFVSWARANNVRVLLSWLPMARNAKLDLENPKAIASMDRIVKFADSLDLEFLGDPEEYVMDIELFYDTSHHTTAAGASERTRRLLPHLKQALSITDIHE